ncbi:MAG: ABC transporter ATP-binding protein [Candidatus Wallbacteria bacterium]
MLEIKELCFKYENKKNVFSIKNINFIVPANEITAVIGPNGSGKSTLLKNIAGFLKPECGSVILDGKDIIKNSSEDMARIFSFMPQKNAVPDYTVFDAVLLGRMPHINWNVSENDLKIVNSIIGELGLSNLSMRNVASLSGGELQKVILARIIVQNTKVLLLDEPTNFLDIRNQIEVMNAIRRTTKKNPGITTIMVVHDINMAFKYADKFILMREGKIFACGGKNIINRENIKSVFAIDVRIENINNHPVVIPY